MYLQKMHSFYISVYSWVLLQYKILASMCESCISIWKAPTDDLKQKAGGRKGLQLCIFAKYQMPVHTYFRCHKWKPRGSFFPKNHTELKNYILLAYQKQNWVERIWYLPENQGMGSYLPLSSATPFARANFILELESEIQWELMSWMHKISGCVCTYVKTLKIYLFYLKIVSLKSCIKEH